MNNFESFITILIASSLISESIGYPIIKNNQNNDNTEKYVEISAKQDDNQSLSLLERLDLLESETKKSIEYLQQIGDEKLLKQISPLLKHIRLLRQQIEKIVGCNNDNLNVSIDNDKDHIILNCSYYSEIITALMINLNKKMGRVKH